MASEREPGPPADYELDDELSILGLELSQADFDGDAIGTMPPPPAVKWVALIAAVLIIVCIAMVV